MYQLIKMFGGEERVNHERDVRVTAESTELGNQGLKAIEKWNLPLDGPVPCEEETAVATQRDQIEQC